MVCDLRQKETENINLGSKNNRDSVRVMMKGEDYYVPIKDREYSSQRFHDGSNARKF